MSGTASGNGTANGRVVEWARGNRLVRAAYRKVVPARMVGHSHSTAIVAVANRMSIGNAAKFANLLRLASQVGLSEDVARAVASRAPHSSEAQYQLARSLFRAEAPGGREAILAAYAGDLEDVSLATITAFALRRVDRADWDSLFAALPGADEARVRPRDLARTLRMISEARTFKDGGQPDLVTSPEAIADDTVELLISWAASGNHWGRFDVMVSDLGGVEEIGRRFPLTLERLVRSFRKRGDLESLTVASDLAADANPTRGFLQAARWADDALTLSREGWPAPQHAPRSAGEPGRLGYLVHNSLPYNSGGYATRSHGLLTGLVSRGWRPTAVTRPPYPLGTPASKRFRDAGKPMSQSIDGVLYRRVITSDPTDLSSTNVLHFAKHVETIAKDERWDVIHGASNHTVGLAGVQAAAALGLPSIYEVRGLWELTRISREPEYELTSHYAMYQRLEADACRLADHAFAITEAVKAIMVDRGVPADHITILPNGVDTRRFKPLAPNAALRSRLGLDGKVVIGYVGSIVDYEGLPLLAKAVKQLDDEGLPVALLVVGDGHVVYQLKEAVAELGIEHITIMPGRVPHEQVEDYYSIIDIAPFPRLPLPVTEAVSPLKPFEAMAMAKPIVVSSVAALTEIVTEGVNGRIFDKGDADSLARILAEMVEDADGRAALGHAARDWVAENRSWQVISTRIDEVYAKLGVAAPRR